jgi:hypothetical protein
MEPSVGSLGDAAKNSEKQPGMRKNIEERHLFPIDFPCLNLQF